jgi:hypothetical protein
MVAALALARVAIAHVAAEDLPRISVATFSNESDGQSVSLALLPLLVTRAAGGLLDTEEIGRREDDEDHEAGHEQVGPEIHGRLGGGRWPHRRERGRGLGSGGSSSRSHGEPLRGEDGKWDPPLEPFGQ